jgi:CDGSH iron-sulfur domain-containing protein 3
MTNSLPHITQKAPFKIAVEQGKKYFWCSCGLSQKQPFCDGSHKAHKNADGSSVMKSVVYEAAENAVIRFCGCRHSKKGAICDGTHNSL